MQQDEDNEAAEDSEGEAVIRNVSEVDFPGRPPVIVRTTHVGGDDPERVERVRAGLRRLAREGKTSRLRG